MPSLEPARMTRRSLLGAAAVGGGALGYASLPAWARTFTAQAAAGRRAPDSLPFPHLPAGTPSMKRIEHVVVLMMENHSFDNILGMVPHRIAQRSGVDGLRRRAGRIVDWNPGASGGRVYSRRDASPCQLDGEPTQAWNASHEAYADGRMNGFVRASGDIAMAYWDDDFLPFTYSLARHFPIGERYFCSTLCQTYPNRRFFFCGTASGVTTTDALSFNTPAANGTIFDRLDAHHIPWANYFQNAPSLLIVPGAGTGRSANFHPMSGFYADAAAGRLPSFTFVDPQYTTTSEENPQDMQVGERFVASVVRALMRGPKWGSTALFITYDEHGGYYDHVAPPRAIAPDAIAPIQEPTQPPLAPGGFDRYGFRVPLLVVSPWARPGYVSRVVQDHTSITAFIERKWNLPAMTYRDANARPMTDYFDFRRPSFMTAPALAGAPGLRAGLAKCTAAGLHPPLPAP